MASMSDNPLIGDYTKGISKNTEAYFKALEARARREKFAVKKLKTDFENPLFAMLRAPLDPLKMLKGRDPVAPKKAAPAPAPLPKKEAEKRVEKVELSTGSGPKKGSKTWQKVALSELSRAFGIRCKNGEFA